MPTMTVQSEIEVTPDVAKQYIQAFRDTSAKQPFPFGNGTWIRLKPSFEKAIQAIEGMPALVMTSSADSAIAIVGIVKPTGVSVALASAAQIQGAW